MRDQYEILRRIKAAGCPIETDLPIIESKSEISIAQTGDAYLFHIPGRGIAMALWVRLAREKSGRITIAEFGDVYLPWGTERVIWLDRPFRSRMPIYRLPNRWDFSADTVLNDRLYGEGLCVRSGRLVEGYVLGTILGRVPDQYSDGSVVDAEFSVVDALGREFRGPVRFVVDRSTGTRSQRRSVRPGVGVPGERPLESPVDPVEPPPLDTSSQRIEAEGRPPNYRAAAKSPDARTTLFD